MFKKILVRSLLVVAVIAVVIAALGYWWQENRLSVPTPLALAALHPDDQVQVTEGDWLTFAPKQEPIKLGVVFYPGAHCDVRGYAPLLRAIAERGYLVVAVAMPLYFAFLAPERALQVVAAHPETKAWVMRCHGGTLRL